jgi:hypothetical protein
MQATAKSATTVSVERPKTPEETKGTASTPNQFNFTFTASAISAGQRSVTPTKASATKREVTSQQPQTPDSDSQTQNTKLAQT